MPSNTTLAPAWCELSIIEARFCCNCAGGCPRRPSLPPSSSITRLGLWAASSAGRRAWPPALVSPLIDALTTLSSKPSSLRRACNSDTQPWRVSRPKPALILSPTTSSVPAAALWARQYRARPALNHHTRIGFSMGPSILVAQNLSKVVPSAEGDLTILHALSLDLAQGDSLAIVGASGSGKSTLLGLLA